MAQSPGLARSTSPGTGTYHLQPVSSGASEGIAGFVWRSQGTLRTPNKLGSFFSFGQRIQIWNGVTVGGIDQPAEDLLVDIAQNSVYGGIREQGQEIDGIATPQNNRL